MLGPLGQGCGTILWEAKRTKHWTDGWLAKLRDDQRAAEADLAIIVSHAVPKDLQGFDHIDGVWVAEPKCAVAVAVALRESLVAIAAARLAERRPADQDGAVTIPTGPRFRQRIEAGGRPVWKCRLTSTASAK